MGTTTEKLQAVLDSKDAIMTSLEEKGLEPTEELSTYASLINELENTSDATATPEDIVEGATAYTANGKVTGTGEPGIPIVTTEGDGTAYTVTVPHMTELKVGKKITIIPHVASTSTTPTLNVNELGAKVIRQRLSTNTSITTAIASNGWLVANKPVTVMYNGTYWVAELTRPDANNLYGTVPIKSGGTGATTAEVARTNLGAASSSDLKYKIYNSLDDIGCSSYVFSDVLTAMPDYSILEMDSSNFVTPNSLGSSLKYGIITFTRVSSSRMKIELVTSNKNYYVWHGSSSSVSSASLELANYSMLTWKLLKEQAGSVDISLADIEFSELIVRVMINNNIDYTQSFTIPATVLTDTTASMFDNYNQALMVSFYYDINRIKLTAARDENNVDKTSSSTTYVYYR